MGVYGYIRVSDPDQVEARSQRKPNPRPLLAPARLVRNRGGGFIPFSWPARPGEKKMTDRIETIGQDVLATIKGVSVESTGRAVAGSIDECQSFCEQWLFEQSSIQASGLALDEIVDGNPDWTLLKCRQVLAVDAALAAYYAAHKHATDNLAAAPVA